MSKRGVVFPPILEINEYMHTLFRYVFLFEYIFIYKPYINASLSKTLFKNYSANMSIENVGMDRYTLSKKIKISNLLNLKMMYRIKKKKNRIQN